MTEKTRTAIKDKEWRDIFSDSACLECNGDGVGTVSPDGVWVSPCDNCLGTGLEPDKKKYQEFYNTWYD